MLSTPVISLFHEGRSWHVIQYLTSINYTSTPGIHGDEGMGIPRTNIRLKAPFENVFKNSIGLLQEFWASTCLDNTSECDLNWLQAFPLNSPKQLQSLFTMLMLGISRNHCSPWNNITSGHSI
jgi:hypothetical protein